MDSDQPSSATAKWCPFFVPTHHVIIIAWSPFLFGDPSSSINKSARKKNFFSWPLSLLLLFYGEFSEWAYAFSWIMLFQLVVFLMWPCIFLCHILVTSPSQLKKNTFCTRFWLEMFHFTHDIRRWNNIIF